MSDLDTRTKRASSVQLMSPWMASPVAPDGAFEQGDRQHIAFSYALLAIPIGGWNFPPYSVTLNATTSGLATIPSLTSWSGLVNATTSGTATVDDS